MGLGHVRQGTPLWLGLGLRVLGPALYVGESLAPRFELYSRFAGRSRARVDIDQGFSLRGRILILLRLTVVEVGRHD